MLAISTSFVPDWESFDGRDLVRLLERWAISAVELEYRIPASRCVDVKINLKRAGITVTSVHNFFPFPDRHKGLRPSGDLFNLADLDPEKRIAAVAGTEQSITHANDLEAGSVVLHCGWVEMDHQAHQIKQFLADDQLHNQTSQTFIQNKIRQLEEKKEKHISCLLFSLEKLLPIAEKQGVRLGLENRFHYHELPTYADFGRIFQEFKGAPVGYWHDTGHSHALETSKLIEPESLLRSYSENLIGMHLHDAIGLEDHLAPGKGEINLTKILAGMNRYTTFVLELKSGTSKSDIQSGIQHLSPKLPQ